MINVLLIEDDLIVQRVHQLMLTKLGCNVVIAGNGQQALEKISQDPSFSIIFVDIGLPDVSGFELIKTLRNLDFNNSKSIPIIALTGYSGQIETQACLDAGATEVTYKPVVNSTLHQILHRNKTSSVYYSN